MKGSGAAKAGHRKDASGARRLTPSLAAAPHPVNVPQDSPLYPFGGEGGAPRDESRAFSAPGEGVIYTGCVSIFFVLRLATPFIWLRE